MTRLRHGLRRSSRRARVSESVSNSTAVLSRMVQAFPQPSDKPVAESAAAVASLQTDVRGTVSPATQFPSLSDTTPRRAANFSTRRSRTHLVPLRRPQSSLSPRRLFAPPLTFAHLCRRLRSATRAAAAFARLYKDSKTQSTRCTSTMAQKQNIKQTCLAVLHKQ